jgi:hypothetical protein
VALDDDRLAVRRAAERSARRQVAADEFDHRLGAAAGFGRRQPLAVPGDAGGHVQQRGQQDGGQHRRDEQLDQGEAAAGGWAGPCAEARG